MKNKNLVILMFALLFNASMACSQQSNKKPESRQTNAEQVKPISELLSPAAFAKRMKEKPGLLIDVRTPQETAKGIIEGAKLLNLFDDNFENEIDKLDRNTTYYVYCASGGRSSEAAELMIKKGFKHVVDLEGGYMRWTKEGMPVKQVK
jgi:rhodanese-related sulfurtransferase